MAIVELTPKRRARLLLTVRWLIGRLFTVDAAGAGVIPWASPVVAFGNLSRSRIATVGLNPSNREFVDISGEELTGAERRFHTLKSLGLSHWSNATEKEFNAILNSCDEYFSRNPYDTWFKALDFILAGTRHSYYHEASTACHLDLIPYATSTKWTALTRAQRQNLHAMAEDTMGLLLRDSPVECLILNGRTVVDTLQEFSNVAFTRRLKPAWALPRASGKDVQGYAYTASIDKIGQVSLGKDVRVLGYNHNIQSSFGVTSSVRASIRDWITTSWESRA